jgi:sterol desaturase/sphingolipid hydroxylase (fatty acid hydroxylase superfamily)
MKNQTPQNEELFRSPLMKFLSFTNRQITVTYISVYIIVLFYFQFTLSKTYSFLFLALSFFAGIIFWTLFEYILHRFLFHIKGESKAIKRFAYLMHGIHHDKPRVENWVFMPPFPGTLYIFIFGVLFYGLFNKLSFVILAGFISGYLIYSNIHFYIHLKRPIKRFSFFWKHHSIHHYKHPDKAFGVTSPFWDIVFGTMPPAK